MECSRVLDKSSKNIQYISVLYDCMIIYLRMFHFRPQRKWDELNKEKEKKRLETSSCFLCVVCCQTFSVCRVVGMGGVGGQKTILRMLQAPTIRFTLSSRSLSARTKTEEMFTPRQKKRALRLNFLPPRSSLPPPPSAAAAG